MPNNSTIETPKGIRIMDISVENIANLVSTQEDAEELIRLLTDRFELTTPEDVIPGPDIMEIHRLINEISQNVLLSDNVAMFNFIGDHRDTLPGTALSLNLATSQECVDDLFTKLDRPGWDVEIVGKVMRGRKIMDTVLQVPDPEDEHEFDSAIQAWEWAKRHGRPGFDAKIIHQDGTTVIRRRLVPGPFDFIDN